MVDTRPIVEAARRWRLDDLEMYTTIELIRQLKHEVFDLLLSQYHMPTQQLCGVIKKGRHFISVLACSPNLYYLYIFPRKRRRTLSISWKELWFSEFIASNLLVAAHSCPAISLLQNIIISVQATFHIKPGSLPIKYIEWRSTCCHVSRY